MGICESCKTGAHAKHTAKYPARIGGKGMGAKTRTAECECVICNRASGSISIPVDTSPSVRTWTPEACPKCSHASHWTDTGACDVDCPICKGDIRRVNVVLKQLEAGEKIQLSFFREIHYR